MEMNRFQRQTTSLAMTTKMQAALRILQMSNTDLTAYLTEQALENPCLDLRPPKNPPGPVRTGPAIDWDEIGALQDAPPSLYAHVAAQLPLAFDRDEDHAIALAFTGALEPSGWLGTPVAEIAAACGVPEPAAEAVLARLQGLEPAGLFARSLAECLRLQLCDQGLLTWEMETILDHLDLLAAGRIDALATLCDADPDDIRRARATIRSLNPKPGEAFSDVRAPVQPPDLCVRHRDGAWEVDLNRSHLPRLRLTDDTLPAPDAATRAYLAQAAGQARWLVRAVERRQATLLRTAACLVRHQSAFLEHGPRHLRPLSMEDVAAELSLHPSTISRATATRLIETPRGTLPLKALFSRSVAAETVSGAQSQDALIALVGEIVAAEDRTRPLSDAAIVTLAREAGAMLARRTVTKYRESLGIPSSYDRRRIAASAC
ncbi:RNA polymerase factor sigma-54 [Paracoccaceae bacterium Fryx2]|nr:RNA polymerase factor sigma-54 [Paracoccaceae bacterium Fryx2]